MNIKTVRNQNVYSIFWQFLFVYLEVNEKERNYNELLVEVTEILNIIDKITIQGELL